MEKEKKQSEKLEALMINASQVNEALSRSRSVARQSAFKVFSQMDKKLADALGGVDLLALPNLGSNSRRFYGLQIRGDLKAKLTDRESLVLGRDGCLYVATKEDRRLAGPEDMRIEDVMRYAQVVEIALLAHLEAAKGASTRYQALANLAEDLEKSLG